LVPHSPHTPPPPLPRHHPPSFSPPHFTPPHPPPPSLPPPLPPFSPLLPPHPSSSSLCFIESTGALSPSHAVAFSPFRTLFLLLPGSWRLIYSATSPPSPGADWPNVYLFPCFSYSLDPGPYNHTLLALATLSVCYFFTFTFFPLH